MNREVITIDENASMLTAAKMMGEKKIGSLVVTRKENAWGIVTAKDLITILAKGKDPADIRIKDAMFIPLISIQPKATIADAAKMMIQRGSRLVVFEGGNLIGVLTPSDIIKSLPECPETLLKIDDFMSQEIVSLDESASAIDTIKLMENKKVGSVIVNRSGKPHSIFTDGDLLRHYFTKKRDLSDPIQNVGSSTLKSIPSGTTIHKMAYIMSKEKVTRLPVVKNDRLIGIITARDLIRAYTESDQL
jgi:CBS domain-containing protein